MRHVNKQCSGKVNISVVGPAAIKSLEQWNAVKNGVVDIHFGPATYFSGVLPEGDVVSLAEISPGDMRKNGALAMLQQRIAEIGQARLEEDLANAYKALATAMSYDLDRYPAMIFDEEVVIYGLTDVTQATQIYQDWLRDEQGSAAHE